MVNQHTGIVNEAKRLYELGFGVHWLKPNSKAPVKERWSSGPREPWSTLKKEFRGRFGLGVRLGDLSTFPDDTYLASLDIDIKSDDIKHREEALAFVEQIYPGILSNETPTVKTGFGLRPLFRVKHPLKSRKLASSDELIKVKMPTAPSTKEQNAYVQKGLIAAEDLENGWRIRPAWEVEVMCIGKQVVLPPTTHPDTGKEYQWTTPLKTWGDIPIFGEPKIEQNVSHISKDARKALTKDAPFTPILVNYDDPRFTKRARKMIFGEDVVDRSAALFSLTLSMINRGFNENEILNALTDRETFLGRTPYEHAKTDDRRKAVKWAHKYCLTEAYKKSSRSSVELLLTQNLLKRNIHGNVKTSFENVLIIFENALGSPLFRRDSFSCQDFYGINAPWIGGTMGKAVNDDDVVAIKEWITKEFGFEPNVSTIYEAITVVAIRNSFHPVQEELRALPPWDKTPRIDNWLAKHFQAEGQSEYLAAVFRKWLIAAITRTFEPGAKFDWLPIFEGTQGVGKSQFGAILFGHKYFSDWLPSLNDKDAALALCGKRVIELAELGDLRKNEIEAIKAFVTRQVDTIRPPYGRKSLEYRRGTVFFGTTNNEHYLRDETGNRRFCPIKVGRLDFEALIRDRTQLWAEALAIYHRQTEKLYLEGAAEEYAEFVRRQKITQSDVDVMVDLIADFMAAEQKKALEEHCFPFKKFKLNDLFTPGSPLSIYEFNGKTSQHVATALRRLGAVRLPGTKTRYWGFQTQDL